MTRVRKEEEEEEESEKGLIFLAHALYWNYLVMNFLSFYQIHSIGA